MSLIDRIKSAQTIVKVVLGLMTLFPGIAILLGLVEIPPTVGNMIYVISFSVSILVILSIFLMTDWIQNLSNGRAVALAALALIVGGVCLTFYIPYTTNHLVLIHDDEEKAARYLTPRRPSEEILRLVPHETRGYPTIAEYRDALQMSGERDLLKQKMVAESWSVMAVMLILLVLSEALLIAPVIGLAWKLAGAGMGTAAEADQGGKPVTPPPGGTGPSPPAAAPGPESEVP